GGGPVAGLSSELVADRVDAHRNLLPGEHQISVFDAVRGDEFLKRFEFVLLPVRIIEILVEQDDGAFGHARRDEIENGLGRAVDVASDVNEGDRARMAGEPYRQAGVEQAGVQLHVLRHARQAAFNVEGLLAEPEALPLLGKALEAVETVDGALADAARDVAD